ncbi:MAG: hypothetical protein GY894_01330 [Planctomycetes bacterium]|jgi:ribonuclease BN (tRNA processing enzyme)|nr:hypothetical protein [Planctomycetota bacterium]MCP4837992.1 hypothetical protein [Planctomycetota bacterium]
MTWHGIGFHATMYTMKLIVTGIGDAFSALHYGSSGIIDAGSGLVAIDCPGAVLAMYRAAASCSGVELGFNQLHDIILTHLHGDHSNGLETIGFARRYCEEEGTRPRLHALPEVLDRVWEKLAPAMDGASQGGTLSTLEDYFEPRPLDPEGVVRIAGMDVRCRRTRHSIPTAGLLFCGAGGTLGWSGDTEFERAHIEWLAEADCIVHECGGHSMHTKWEELDGLPAQIKSRIRLIHRPDDDVDHGGVMKPLIEGEVIDIGG